MLLAIAIVWAGETDRQNGGQIGPDGGASGPARLFSMPMVARFVGGRRV